MVPKPSSGVFHPLVQSLGSYSTVMMKTWSRMNHKDFTWTDKLDHSLFCLSASMNLDLLKDKSSTGMVRFSLTWPLWVSSVCVCVWVWVRVAFRCLYSASCTFSDHLFIYTVLQNRHNTDSVALPLSSSPPSYLTSLLFLPYAFLSFALSFIF